MKPEELLAHADFVRHLAQSLVLDIHEAADISQETYLAALKHPPARDKSLRSWFYKVTRNFQRKHLRNENRRWRREGAVAIPDVVPPTEEIVEREELRARVVKAVLSLKEPYRSTILLRFYEDMPPRKIALHFEVPTETVRTRIKKGIDLLRSRLDREHGEDRMKWRLALLPVAGWKLTPSPAGTLAGISTILPGGLAMIWKWTLLVSTVILLGAALGVWHLFLDEAAEAPLAPDPDSTFASPAAPAQGVQPSHGEEEKTVLKAASASLSGSVLNDQGGQVANAHIFIQEEGREPEVIADSDRSGAFETDSLRPGAFQVYAETDDGLRSPGQKIELEARQPLTVLLEVGSWYEITGRITALADGSPVAKARVEALGINDARSFSTLSKGDGTFLLEGLNLTYYLLKVSSKGYGMEMREGVVGGESSVDFQLISPGTLHGKVVDQATSRPLHRFRIELVPRSFHARSAQLKEKSLDDLIRLTHYQEHGDFSMIYSLQSVDGTFEINDLACAEYYLAVTAEGYEILEPENSFTIESGRKTYQSLMLAQAGILEGTVLDPEGRPMEEARLQRVVLGPHGPGPSLLKDRVTHTDWEGRFEFPHAEKGLNMIEVSHPDCARRLAMLLFQEGILSQGASNQEGVSLEGNRLIIQLEDKKEGGRVAVHASPEILDTSETPPMIGIMGMAGKEVGILDAEGRYLSRALEPSLYNALLMCDGKIVENRPCEVKEGETLVLRFGDAEGTVAMINGKVTCGLNAYTGQGFVTLIRFHEEGNQPVNSGQLEEGCFSLPVKETGKGHLAITPYSRDGTHTFGFFHGLEWGGDRKEYDLYLDLPMANLKVKILDEESRESLEGARIELARSPSTGKLGPWEFKGNAGGVSQKDGSVHMKYLPSGSYTLHLECDGYAAIEKQLEIHELDALSMNISMLKAH